MKTGVLYQRLRAFLGFGAASVLLSLVCLTWEDRLATSLFAITALCFFVVSFFTCLAIRDAEKTVESLCKSLIEAGQTESAIEPVRRLARNILKI